jgi:hypothetical protein
MRSKLIWRHRIVAALVNCTLDYFLVRFTLRPLYQITILEWEWEAEKPWKSLVSLCNSKPFNPFTNMSSSYQQFVLTDKHFLERSLIHSAKSLVSLCNSKPFNPFTNMSSSYQQFVLTDKHFLERSLIHSANRCPGTSSEGGVFCGRILLLCIPLYYAIS